MATLYGFDIAKHAKPVKANVDKITDEISEELGAVPMKKTRAPRKKKVQEATPPSSEVEVSPKRTVSEQMVANREAKALTPAQQKKLMKAAEPIEIGATKEMIAASKKKIAAEKRAAKAQLAAAEKPAGGIRKPRAPRKSLQKKNEPEPVAAESVDTVAVGGHVDESVAEPDPVAEPVAVEEPKRKRAAPKPKQDVAGDVGPASEQTDTAPAPKPKRQRRVAVPKSPADGNSEKSPAAPKWLKKFTSDTIASENGIDGTPKKSPKTIRREGAEISDEKWGNEQIRAKVNNEVARHLTNMRRQMFGR